jgi:hypothetical protein
MMIKATDSVERVRSAFPWGYSVGVSDQLGFPAFRESNGGVLRDYVLDWCTKNCSSPVLVGGLQTIFFKTEEDAILFYMRFK